MLRVRMYLLQKYDALQGADHAEFLNKEVPPWHISDDTCGPLPEPPVPSFYLLAFQVRTEVDFGMRLGAVAVVSPFEVLRGGLLQHVSSGPPLPEHPAR